MELAQAAIGPGMAVYTRYAKVGQCLRNAAYVMNVAARGSSCISTVASHGRDPLQPETTVPVKLTLVASVAHEASDEVLSDGLDRPRVLLRMEQVTLGHRVSSRVSRRGTHIADGNLCRVAVPQRLARDGMTVRQGR